jgi:cell division septum initiation protein DivIVA
MTDHWQVIEGALESQKRTLTHLRTLGFQTEETRVKIDRLLDDIDAALAFAKEQRQLEARIKELEAQVRKLKAEKQEAIRIICELGFPVEDIEVETMTREQYEKEYGDDD